jgi:hypothetical protein
MARLPSPVVLRLKLRAVNGLRLQPCRRARADTPSAASKFGAHGRTRTCITGSRNPALVQLSYVSNPDDLEEWRRLSESNGLPRCFKSLL